MKLWNQITQENQRNYQFWDKLNSLPDPKYLRMQRLCTVFLGGWVRGLRISEKGIVSLIIE